MATIVTTSFSSMRAHHANGAVLWDIVKRMALAVIAGTFLATFIAAQIPSLYLAIFFALFMGYVSIQMFLNKKPSPSHKPASSTELLGVGAGIGAISALVSIGGGSLTVPYLSWRNVDIKKAIGTSAAMGLPISLAGACGYLLNHDADLATIPYTIGFVYWPAVLLMSICSFFTAPLGAKLAHRLPVATLKKVFAISLMLLNLKMLTALL
ncbi:sulfite exporter TauE/SafE family protein [Alkanindiges illinoisensis]|uniref:sulfite exporter TauE/SafE family protein n=1 Tax=Alkanindiges illinoisensis TaxID=197183 RepID=UPI00196A28C2|nr:sulfite exporter TauE/SafE family protein [Alkanindiges illinoisensis]